ncbi:Mobile element protein [hydrothermal vent metagenome]|uniref:Mobile element protein n=1 Tax=hydrothermal vent metagenome TaxID=652676 RepID=A0A1W1BNX5_9ZZZZ
MKAVKVRLYPNAKQQQIIASQIGAVRYVYNRTLALRINAYKKFGLKVGKFDLIKHVTKLKNRDNTSWLKEADSQALQQSVANMDSAYKHFFKGGGYPKFKSKHHSRQSFQYPQRVKIENNKLYLPKVGWVKCKGLRDDITGKIKTVTVSYEAYQYHASILFDTGDIKPKINTNNKVIGLDVGVSLMIADSDGNKIKPLDLVRELSKLRIKAQQLSRKKKGSKNRAKAKAKVAKQNLHIANMRKDFLHKLSKQYSENQTVVVEDLKIKNMTKATKGTVEKPSKNAKAKRGLNRSITQQSWGMFFELLEYKLKANGGELIKVNPKFTSQTCNKCGHISKENRQSQSKFVCTSCGHTANADINASKNILDRGIHGNNACLKIAS